ncbi:MAM and LDL-receptor class A domain-containing protein 1-like [Diadema antillarum]|uniref:MAM and LDL-receptor class A domain-containing protein 1-like n=1 Tax=Diadema antillarum TaxID=105358 RepID=UPI003A887193
MATTQTAAPTTPPPRQSLDCTFEDNNDGFCGFQQDTADVFDWTRHAGKTASANTGPSVDHTYGTGEGYYIYTEASNPRRPGDIANLLTPPLVANGGDKCFSFYYQLNGEDVGSLRILFQRENSTDRDTLREWSGDQGTVWQKASITISQRNYAFQIIFESVVGESYRGDVAIDDVTFEDSPCPLETLMCTFEDKRICGFTQDRTDDFNFYWWKGRTWSWGTGPRYDHTFKNSSGHYMFMEASYMQDGHTARLISPPLMGYSSKPSCMIFFYHMYGYEVGELNVYIKNETSDALGNPVWSLAGNRGDRWRAAEVQITTPLIHQVVFEAVRGESSSGDIAIDDVNITFAECPGHHVYRNESSVTCQFEEAELCHYKQDKTDDFDWRWTNRGTFWRFTGPSIDHTRKDELGFFVYIDATFSGPRDAVARLISPEVPPQRRKSCVVFWYHMYGRDVEELKVYIQPRGESLPSTPAWRESGDHGDVWHRAAIDISLRNIAFKIVFEGKRGAHIRDDIALDDVELFQNSPCPDFYTTPPAPTTLPPIWRDISCTFEEGYCNYTQAWDDIFDWVRHQGKNTWSFWEPKLAKDHTLGNSQGYFMIMNNMWWFFHRPNDMARMYSPLLQESSTPRCLQFFYLLNGWIPEVFLNVYVLRYGDTLAFDPDLSYVGHKGVDWQEALLDIPPSDYPVYIVFEGVLGRLWWHPETGLDDITLLEGKCQRSTTAPLPMQADCDFEGKGEAALCGFTNKRKYREYWWYRDQEFNWMMNSGNTSTLETGPPSDHTFRNATGHYMYMEASQPQRPGDRARLISPPLSSNGQRICLHFYFYMKGRDMGALSVKWLTPTAPEKEIYRAKTKLADRWQSAYVDISFVSDNYQVIFEGVVGNGYRGDIAIDDIRFLPMPCSGYEAEVSCGFDMGYEDCFFRQDDVNLLEWLWFDSVGIDPSPLANISAPVGSFLYITSSSMATANSAVLRLPKLRRLDMDHCLSLDAIVRGDAKDAALTVAVEYTNNTWRPLLKFCSLNASQWTTFYQTIDLDLIQEDPFQIRLSATITNSNGNAIIAIDNVTLSQASCDVVKANARSSGGRGGGGGGGRGSTALGAILGLVLVAVVVMLIAAWFYIRRSGGFGDTPFAIKYKNKEDNANPVTLSGEAGISNPVYEKSA